MLPKGLVASMVFRKIVKTRWVYGPNGWALLIILVNLQSALGWDYQSDLSKHGSQTDATKGFGGRYGVQTDRQDDVSYNHSNEHVVHPKHIVLYIIHQSIAWPSSLLLTPPSPKMIKWFIWRVACRAGWPWLPQVMTNVVDCIATYFYKLKQCLLSKVTLLQHWITTHWHASAYKSVPPVKRHFSARVLFMGITWVKRWSHKFVPHNFFIAPYVYITMHKNARTHKLK